MKVNEQMAERVLRVALGLALISIVFVGPQTTWGLIGIIPLITGIVGVCPLYSVLGVSTCKECES